jgi:hypothetical protein
MAGTEFALATMGDPSKDCTIKTQQILNIRIPLEANVFVKASVFVTDTSLL